MSDHKLLPSLLGHSSLSDQIKTFQSGFHFKERGDRELDIDDNVYRAMWEDKKAALYLEFKGYRRYVSEFGEPESVKNKKNDELILTQITVENSNEKNTKQSPVILPFDIRFGDDAGLLTRKLGKKPLSKSANSYGQAWWFQFENFRLLTALNHDHQLIFIRLFRMDLREIRKIKLKRQLGSQNKNINPANTLAIVDLEKKLPTLKWKKRMKAGDDNFSESGIREVELLLKQYIQLLADLVIQKKVSPIYNSVKKLVIGINKVNDKHGGFIDTLEREELSEFIHLAVRKTGLQFEDDLDLTEEWREW